MDNEGDTVADMDVEAVKETEGLLVGLRLGVWELVRERLGLGNTEPEYENDIDGVGDVHRAVPLTFWGGIIKPWL